MPSPSVVPSKPSLTTFILEEPWAHGTLERLIPSAHVPKDLCVRDMHGAISRGIAPSVNLEIYEDGIVSEQSLNDPRAGKVIVKG